LNAKSGEDFQSRPEVQIGAFPPDTWVNVSLTESFNVHPDGGLVQISINGVDKGTIAARTLVNTDISNPIYFYTMVYGPAGATPVSPFEYVDFDDITITAVPIPPPLITSLSTTTLFSKATTTITI